MIRKKTGKTGTMKAKLTCAMWHCGTWQENCNSETTGFVTLLKTFAERVFS